MSDYTAAGDRALRHSWLLRCVELLGDGNAPNFYMPQERRRPSPSWPEAMTAINWPPH